MSVNIDQRWEKWNFKKSQKNSVDYPRYSRKENINFSFIGWIFWRYGECQVWAIYGLRQTAFQAFRPGYEKTAISIKFKYHPTQKVCYRIKRVLIQILSGHVLELMLTEIFYRFLNIYKILRILHVQNIVKFQRP